MNEITEQKIIKNYNHHHSAWTRGYVSVNQTIIKAYKGRFGAGFTIERNNRNSSQYHTKEYWIAK